MKIKFVFLVIGAALAFSSCKEYHTYHKFDTTKGNYYKFDSSKSDYENYVSGYTDTFSVDNIRFRIIAKDSDLLIIQKFKSQQWLLVDSMPACYYFECAFVAEKTNKAAPLNLYPYIKYFLDRDQFSCVFLYDTIAKTFVKSGFWNRVDSVVKIQDNIYCDMGGFCFSFDNTWTTLYVIKNLRRYNLGYVERIPQDYYSPIYDSTNTNEFILIKKINNDTEFVTVDSFKIKGISNQLLL